MKPFAFALAACLIGGSALAQTTVIEKEQIGGSTTVIKERSAPDTVVVKERTESTGAVGCSTKSVTRTDDLGDTTKKTKVEC